MLGLEIAGLEGEGLYLVRAPFIEKCHLPILVVAGAQGWGRWGGGVVGKKVTLRFGGWMDKVYVSIGASKCTLWG